MAIKPNQVRYLTSQHDGVGPLLNDKDWFKTLFKKTLCSSATMKEYTATFSEYNAEDRTVKITTSGNSLYWTGQVIKLSGISIPATLTRIGYLRHRPGIGRRVR